ncbi:hypothetical protein GPL15_20250 [Clostridium sp. MCC353]|uniref:hypothetical protein n=1 Tax=Clostridium sp. MCC353 TaxID=2592646 RepID=UPI001C02DBB1|nr:hypothetical protein [Clostridium sp. MCC353]MBT9778814.1 hypothetical protein [Clostridium sp. MCC353]
MVVMEMRVGNSVLKIDDDSRPVCEKEREHLLEMVVKLITQYYMREGEEDGNWRG